MCLLVIDFKIWFRQRMCNSRMKNGRNRVQKNVSFSLGYLNRQFPLDRETRIVNTLPVSGSHKID